MRANDSEKSDTGFLRRFQAALDALVPADAFKGPWIATFSGGPDSMALCLLLEAAQRNPCEKNKVPERIIAFHVNHGLRGQAGDRDAAFAETAAKEMGFEFRSKKLTPPSRNRAGLSMESWARQARYDAVRELVRETGAQVVLTGHQKNDQAETVLLRLLRSAGITGLCGIRPVRPLISGEPCLLIRPLLGFTRASIESYLASSGASSVEDETNIDTTIPRNRVRLKLLPALVRTFPDDTILDELDRTAVTARKIEALLERGAGKALDRATVSKTCAGPDPDVFITPFFGTDNVEALQDPPIALDGARLLALHDALLYPVLRLALDRRFPDKDPLLPRHLFETIVSSIKESALSKTWNVSDTIAIDWTGEILKIRGRPTPADRNQKVFSAPVVPLHPPGVADLPDGSRIEARYLEDTSEAKRYLEKTNPFIELLDADQAGESLSIRSRRPGDRFQPLGAPGPKKLKDFLIDKKVPAMMREGLALVCDNEKILWVVGIRMHHACRMTARTKRVLMLQYVGPGATAE